MNVCFVSLDYPSDHGGGGVGNQVRTLGRALVRAGHRVTVVALGGPGLSPYSEDEGIQVHRFRQGNVHWYLHRLQGAGSLLALAVRELEYGWAGYRVVRDLHARQPFDLVEGTETGALGVALCLHEVPLVVRLHGEHYTFHKYTPDLPITPGLRLSRLLQRAAMRRAKLLISPSRVHAREISLELGGNHPAIEIVPNCIELHGLPDAEPQVGREPVVLFAGRLQRLKGVLPFLAAGGLVLSQHPAVRFVLAGASHPSLPQAEIDASVRRNGLAGHVEFLGHVPHEDLMRWYRRAQICVLPSFYESFGLAALEPMAFGVPVVGTTAGALPEVVQSGTTGVLVPPGDVQGLAEAIGRLLGDPDRRDAMGRAGMARCRRFDVAAVLSANENLYRTASEQRRRGP